MVFVVMMDVFVWGKSCSPFLNHCDFLPCKNQLCKLVVSVLCEFLEKIVVEIPVLLIASFWLIAPRVEALCFILNFLKVFPNKNIQDI